MFKAKDIQKSAATLSFFFSCAAIVALVAYASNGVSWGEICQGWRPSGGSGKQLDGKGTCNYNSDCNFNKKCCGGVCRWPWQCNTRKRRDASEDNAICEASYFSANPDSYNNHMTEQNCLCQSDDGNVFSGHDYYSTAIEAGNCAEKGGSIQADGSCVVICPVVTEVEDDSQCVAPFVYNADSSCPLGCESKGVTGKADGCGFGNVLRNGCCREVGDDITEVYQTEAICENAGHLWKSIPDKCKELSDCLARRKKRSVICQFTRSTQCNAPFVYNADSSCPLGCEMLNKKISGRTNVNICDHYETQVGKTACCILQTNVNLAKHVSSNSCPTNCVHRNTGDCLKLDDDRRKKRSVDCEYSSATEAPCHAPYSFSASSSCPLGCQMDDMDGRLGPIACLRAGGRRDTSCDSNCRIDGNCSARRKKRSVECEYSQNDELAGRGWWQCDRPQFKWKPESSCNPKCENEMGQCQARKKRSVPDVCEEMSGRGMCKRNKVLAEVLGCGNNWVTNDGTACCLGGKTCKKNKIVADMLGCVTRWVTEDGTACCLGGKGWFNSDCRRSATQAGALGCSNNMVTNDGTACCSLLGRGFWDCRRDATLAAVLGCSNNRVTNDGTACCNARKKRDTCTCPKGSALVPYDSDLSSRGWWNDCRKDATMAAVLGCSNNKVTNDGTACCKVLGDRGFFDCRRDATLAAVLGCSNNRVTDDGTACCNSRKKRAVAGPHGNFGAFVAQSSMNKAIMACGIISLILLAMSKFFHMFTKNDMITRIANILSVIFGLITMSLVTSQANALGGFFAANNAMVNVVYGMFILGWIAVALGLLSILITFWMEWDDCGC